MVRDQTDNLILVSLSGGIGEREIVRIGANPQGKLVGRGARCGAADHEHEQ